jgi:hypothetical protein
LRYILNAAKMRLGYCIVIGNILKGKLCGRGKMKGEENMYEEKVKNYFHHIDPDCIFSEEQIKLWAKDICQIFPKSNEANKQASTPENSAKAYDELLKQTEEVCPRCCGSGVFLDPNGRTGGDCPVCNHTGKVQHPKRIVVLEEKPRKISTRELDLITNSDEQRRAERAE